MFFAFSLCPLLFSFLPVCQAIVFVCQLSIIFILSFEYSGLSVFAALISHDKAKKCQVLEHFAEISIQGIRQSFPRYSIFLLLSIWGQGWKRRLLLHLWFKFVLWGLKIQPCLGQHCFWKHTAGLYLLPLVIRRQQNK